MKLPIKNVNFYYTIIVGILGNIVSSQLYVSWMVFIHLLFILFYFILFYLYFFIIYFFDLFIYEINFFSFFPLQLLTLDDILKYIAEMRYTLIILPLSWYIFLLFLKDQPITEPIPKKDESAQQQQQQSVATKQD